MQFFGDTFQTFSATHFTIMAMLLAAGVVIIEGTRRFARPEQYRTVGLFFGVYILLQECVDHGAHYFLNSERLVEVLPLHLCGVSALITGLILIRPVYTLYEVVYFWGLAGAGMAIITPDLAWPFHSLMTVTYFLSHGTIVIGVLYITFLYGYRPTLRSLVKVFIILNLYMVVIFNFNLLFETNYLFIREKPGADTLMNVLGPWPWYILSLEPVTLFFFFLVYSPWLVKDWFTKKTEDNQTAKESAAG